MAGDIEYDMPACACTNAQMQDLVSMRNKQRQGMRQETHVQRQESAGEIQEEGI